MEILRVEHVGLTYQAKNGEVNAFEDINFAVEEGEFLSIVGPSGCGKSTLLSVIAGLLPATRGEVYVKGERVRGTSPHIGYMLQRDNLLEWRTILSNVLFGLEIRGTKTPQAVARAKRLLETYGLAAFADKYPRQLSGGMRQRASLIRTLAAGPDILLLDEAFSALDYQTRHHADGDARYTGEHLAGRLCHGTVSAPCRDKRSAENRIRPRAHAAVLPGAPPLFRLFRPYLEGAADR